MVLTLSRLHDARGERSNVPRAARLSNEIDKIVRLKGKEHFASEGFSGTDYEFFVTDKRGEEKRFYIGAFYNKKDLEEGLGLVMHYKKVLNGM